MLAAAAALAALCLRDGEHALALLVLAACGTAWALCPLVAALAMRLGACSRPGGRSAHTTCIPRMGGLALYVPVAAALLWTGTPHAGALLAGATIMVLVGAIDDIRGLTPRRKIAAQVAAALVLVAGGYRITGLRMDPLGTLPIPGFESAAVIAWIVFTTNAINLIDGADGLAATIAVVAALAHAALGAPVPLALALAAACLGFLRHNLPRARLFLGDTGSLLLGFCLGALPLAAPGPLNLPVALGLLLIPFGDVALCVARRWLRAKPLSAPDRGHLHHVLLRLWQSPPLVLLGFGALAAAQAIAVRLRPDLWGLLTASAFLAATVVYVLSRVRPDWPRIVLHRRAFRRIHLARNYAIGALRISESRPEVRDVLQRVVADLGLRHAQLPGMHLGPAATAAGPLVEEEVECDGATATWSTTADQDDPALLEEKRVVMCDVLREASKRLRWLAPAIAATSGRAAAPAPELSHARNGRNGNGAHTRNGNGAPAPARTPAPIHCVVEDLVQLERIAVLVPAMRQPSSARAIVVFPGRLDDLGPLDGIEAPVVCLDATGDPGEIAARYLELVARDRPSATVVVGEGGVASGCARAARACGIDVVQFDAPPPRRRRAHATSGNSSLRKPVAGRNGGGPGAVDLGIRVIPALQPQSLRYRAPAQQEEAQ